MSAYQNVNGEDSYPYPGWLQVQTSVDDFSPGLALTRIYACSRGFAFGPVARPGARIELLQGAAVIGTADGGSDPGGQAYVTVPGGIPSGPGSVLTLRQIICPKPAPTPPAPHYIVDSPLPPAEPFPFAPGSAIPAPVIVSGLTHCSRSITIEKIIPGADVTIEEADGRWWATLGPSDATTATLELPTTLVQDEKVTIRQEVARRCELRSEIGEQTVGAQEVLGMLHIGQIDCSTMAALFVSGFKGATDIEFGVTVNGAETIHRTVGTVSGQTGNSMPAPPMSPGATVRARQGECGVWGPWSDPPVSVQPTFTAAEPKLPNEVFSCQDALVITNISPMAGSLRIMSDKRGELANTLVRGNVMTVDVGTSLKYEETIWVEHHACGQSTASGKRVVRRGLDLHPGTIEPVFDGDLEVTVSNVNSGARMELWEEYGNRMLQSIRAPFDDDQLTTAVFSGFGEASKNWKLHTRCTQCGQYGRSPTVSAGIRRPRLDSVNPSSVLINSGPFILKLNGDFFRPYARVYRSGPGGDQPWTTTFVSPTQLTAAVPASDLSAVQILYVSVRQQPNVQGSVVRGLTVKSPPAPAPVRPLITVATNGPPSAMTFTVTGSGFLKDQPDNPNGITLRFQDGVNLQDVHRPHTGSNANGSIQKTVGPLDMTLLPRNALGQAKLHISATDSRKDPDSSSANEPLWSQPPVSFIF